MRGSCVIGALASWAVCCTTASPFSSKASSTLGAWTNTTAAPCSSTCESSSSATSTEWPLFWPGHGPQSPPPGSPIPQPQPSTTPGYSSTYGPAHAPMTRPTQYPSSPGSQTHLSVREKCKYLLEQFDDSWAEDAKDSIKDVKKKFYDAIEQGRLSALDVRGIKPHVTRASEDYDNIEAQGSRLVHELRRTCLRLREPEPEVVPLTFYDRIEELRYKAEELEYRQLELEFERTEWLEHLIDKAIKNKAVPGSAYQPPKPPAHGPWPLPLSSLLNHSSIVNETSTSILKRDVEDADDDSAEKRKCRTEFDPKCTAKWERLITSLAAEIGQEKNQAVRMHLEERLQAFELAQFVGCVRPCALDPKHPKHPKLPKQVWTIVSGIISGVVDLLHVNGGHPHPKPGSHPSPSSYHPTKPTSIPDYCQTLGLSRNETLLCNLMHLPGLLHPKSTKAANHTTTPHHTSLHTTMSTVHTTPAPACTSSAYGTGSSSKTHSILSSSTARSGSAMPHAPSSTKVPTSSKPVTSGSVMPHTSAKSSHSSKPTSSSKPRTSSKSSSHSKPTSSQSHGLIYPVPKPHSTTLIQHTYAAQP